MRKSLSVIALLLAVLVLATGCKNKPPKTPDKPIGPTSVLVNTSAAYKSTSTDPNKDRILYIFQWSATATDTTASDFIKSGDPISLSHTWDSLGTYAVKVRAKDEKGNYSAEWSDELSVDVVTDTSHPSNTPPNPPTALTVTGRYWVDTLLTFSASATDPDGDPVQIRFYFGDGASSSWSALKPSGTTVTDTHRYSSGGMKAVKAVAKDTWGDTSALSAAVPVEVQSMPGQPRIQAAPLRGIANGPAYRFYVSAFDSDGDTLRYVFVWGGTETDTVGPFAQGDIKAHGAWTPTGTPGRYTVKVTALDQDGAVSPALDTAFVVVGPGSLLWWCEDDFSSSSPALGQAVTRGELQPAAVIGTDNGTLLFVDAYLGHKNTWPQPPNAVDAFNSSPAIGADGVAYTGCSDGIVYAVNPDMSDKWAFQADPLGGDISATAVLDEVNQVLYVGAENGCLYKVSTNGTFIWADTLASDIVASPAMDQNGNIIVCDDSGNVVSIAPDRTHIWTYATGEWGLTSPAIGADGSTIYVATDAGKLLAIANGDTVWTYQIPYSVSPTGIGSSPVIGPSDFIYFGADDGKAYKINPVGHTPEPGWPVRLNDSASVTSTPLIRDDGGLYVIADDDSLYAIGPNGEHEWAIKLMVPTAFGRKHRPPTMLGMDEQPSIVIDAHGIVYIATDEALFAVSGTAGRTRANSAWPMFHHDAKHTGRYGASR